MKLQLSVHQGVDPRSLSCLGGILLRLAQQMDLHRDGYDQRLPPFEVEMRRRLWWQIVLFDSRVAEFSGIGTSVITNQWTTRLPLNVNDSDLFPDMRESPISHTGATEMMFCLTRCEVAEFVRRVRSTTAFDGCWHELSTPQVPLEVKDREINQLEQLLESKYLMHCDTSIPLHFITTLLTKSSICKLRHIAHHPRLLLDRGANLPHHEKDRFFSWSLEMVEHSNLLHSDKSTQRFAWHIRANKPMHGYIHILSELRHRTTGDLAERAWRRILECFSHWFSLKIFDNKQRHSALFLALANLAVKAWDARARALLQSQPSVSPPEIIFQLQVYLDSWRLQKSEMGSGELPSTGSRDIESGASRYADAPQINYGNLVEANDKIDLSMPIGFLPTDDPMDWVYWNELTLQYPVLGGDDGGKGLSLA
jgi:hypothetical protein